MNSAEVVVVLHLAFIAFVAGGGLFALRWPRIAWIHLPAVAWGAWVQFADWICPLTYLEDALRGEESRPGGFVAYYLMPIVYPDLAQEGILTPTVRIALGCAAISINVVIYAWAFRRHRRRRRGACSLPSFGSADDRGESAAVEYHLRQ